MTQAEAEIKEQMLKVARNGLTMAKIMREHLKAFDTVLNRLDRLEAAVEGMAVGRGNGGS
jgi:hypothetical protein